MLADESDDNVSRVILAQEKSEHQGSIKLFLFKTLEAADPNTGEKEKMRVHEREIKTEDMESRERNKERKMQ